MTVTVFGFLFLVNVDFYDHLFVFFLALVLIAEVYQTLETVLGHISKHLEVREKYFAARRIFSSLLGVWKCGQRQSLVFDMLLRIIILTYKSDF